jgi:hypothetical protein
MFPNISKTFKNRQFSGKTQQSTGGFMIYLFFQKKLRIMVVYQIQVFDCLRTMVMNPKNSLLDNSWGSVHVCNNRPTMV